VNDRDARAVFVAVVGEVGMTIPEIDDPGPDRLDELDDELGWGEAAELGPLPRPIRQALDAERADGWQWDAPCASADPEVWFPDENPLKLVVGICQDCPVRRACLATALLGNEVGIWAGTSANQRREPRRELRDGRQVPLVLDDLLARTGPVNDERDLGDAA